MNRLQGRVVIVTGAGRGLGRSHATYMASQGASVVVNDYGGTVAGEEMSIGPANDVVEEITAMGGAAIASTHDVADWRQAAQLIDLATETFGRLHVLVNNAGIVRDRTLANMSESEWDDVVRVHLKGHAAPTRHAMAYWRDCSKRGSDLKASVVHTTSIAALAGGFGQANYSAAKLGVLGLSRCVALEGAKYGVRSNAVSPSARTRITEGTPGLAAGPKGSNADFDIFEPGNVSPLIGWLAEESCPANEQVFHIVGGRLVVLKVPEIAHELEAPGRWTSDTLDDALRERLVRQVPGRYILNGEVV